MLPKRVDPGRKNLTIIPDLEGVTLNFPVYPQDLKQTSPPPASPTPVLTPDRRNCRDSAQSWPQRSLPLRNRLIP